MAPSQETQFLMHENEPETLYNGCNCFSTCWGKNRVDQSYLLPERAEYREVWVVKQIRKLKEVSELVAGPKWKNFLRKIGAYCKNKVVKSRKKDNFQYDSYDYDLNFDNGIHEDDDGYGVGLGFSSRFAPPIVSDQVSK